MKTIKAKQNKLHETTEIAVDIEAKTGCFSFKFFAGRKHKRDFFDKDDNSLNIRITEV